MFGFLASLVSWIWDGFQAVSDAVVAGLVAAYHFLSAFAGAIWDAAKFSYQNILKPVGIWLDKMYQRAVLLYDQYVQPVIKWLDRVTAVIRKVYFTVLAPILSVIDGVKRMLALLALLHIQLAQKLEDELTALERKLSLPLQAAIQFLNGIINRVESYVLTAENLFQRVTHLGTLRRDLTAVQNIQWGSLLRNVPRALSAPAPARAPLAPIADADAILQNVVDGDGALVGIDVSAASQEFETWLSA
jgi:hypothetical protein